MYVKHITDMGRHHWSSSNAIINHREIAGLIPWPQLSDWVDKVLIEGLLGREVPYQPFLTVVLVIDYALLTLYALVS